MRGLSKTIMNDSESDADRVVECETQIARLRAEIRRIQTTRNSYLPVSRLPPEILCKIFMCVRDLPEEKQHYHASTVATWVKSTTNICRHWRNTALNCPELWSHLDFDRNRPAWMEVQLKRSKKSLLSVVMAPGGEKCDKALLEALRHPGQLRSLRVFGTTSNTITKFMKKLRGAHAPFLERLEFQGSMTSDVKQKTRRHLPSDLFSRGTPSLRKLELHGSPLSFTSPVYQGLHKLKLRTPRWSSFSLPEFLTALGSSPGLKVVDIEFRTPKTLPCTGVPQAVALPNIETLRLISTLPNCKAILNHLALPVSAKLDISLIGASEHDDTIPPDAEVHHSDSKGLVSAIEQAWLSSPLSSISPIDSPNTPVDAPSILSLDYNYDDENLHDLSMQIWLNNRESAPLHQTFPARNPHLRLTCRGDSARILHSSQLFRNLSMDHLESAFIHWGSDLIWDSLMQLPSLKSLGLDDSSASSFFRHALRDPLLNSTAKVVVPDESDAGETIEDDVPPPPLSRFRNLVSLTFMGVDFGYSSYCAVPFELGSKLPVNFDDQLIKYLQLRKKHGAPIQQSSFKVCINFAHENHKKVAEIVDGVEWDGEVETRDDDDFFDSEDDYCEFCGEEDCEADCLDESDY